MAARVGTGATGSANAAASTIAASAQSTTSSNLLVVQIKWEAISTPNVTSVTDTAGNTFTEIVEVQHGSTDLQTSLYYAANITGNASNVVTATFGSASTTFRRIVVEEFSGIATSSSTDGANQTGTGNSTTHSTTDITTTQAGLVVLGVGAYATLSGWSGTPGTPDFSVGATISDTGILYLISGSAQTVTPGSSVAESTFWAAIAQAFKDAGGGGGGTIRSIPSVRVPSVLIF